MDMAAEFNLLLTRPLMPHTILLILVQSMEMSVEFYKPFSGISSNVCRIGSVICSMSRCWSQTGSKKHKDGDISQQSKPAPIQFGEVFFMHSISLSISVLSHPCVKSHIADVCKFIVWHYEIMPVLSSECLSLSSCPYYIFMKKDQARTDVLYFSRTRLTLP